MSEPAKLIKENPPLNRPPHIILILSDEHRGQAMGHMGDRNLRTPEMDRLAAEGASFKRAYANCPICTPSRGTIFSGRHAHAGPIRGFFESYQAGAPSLATELRAAGYHTAYFGKWHGSQVHSEVPPAVRENPKAWGGVPWRTPEHLRGGFQDWFAFEINNKPFDGFYYHGSEINPRRMKGFQTDWLTDMAIEYLRNYDGKKPLFLVLSAEPPHFPLDAPDRFKRFDTSALELRPNFTDTPANRSELALYYAMIENLDWNIGRLRHELTALSGFDHLITSYVSDHGEYLGSHGRSQRKEHPHEESIRIPAIFNFPGIIPTQGGVDGLFSLVDLAPTLLGLAGLHAPSWMQGRDFSPHLLGKPMDLPNEVLLEMTGAPRWNLDFCDWRGFVDNKTKYAFYETGFELLFDLEHDPYEMKNLALDNPAICQPQRERLLHMLRETREPFFDVIIEHGVPIPENWRTVENVPNPGPFLGLNDDGTWRLKT
jgi:arylsulfatase A-like enzyme